jgi:hypothetical protein
MSRDYAETKALDALRQADGDKRRAARILEGWAEEDARLKSAIVRPFFANLCAFAVQRADARATGGGKPKAKSTAAKPSLETVLQAMAGGKRVHVDPGPPSADGPTSAKHQRAMKALAQAYKKRPTR